MPGTLFNFEFQPIIPEKLSGLESLAGDLYYSWDPSVRGLFARLDSKLWKKCGHSPKVFLRRVSQQILDEAAEEHIYLEHYNRAMSSYDSYLRKEPHADIAAALNVETDLVAYFCAEFGLHESFPIYSGGLGILAGDHCKAASDLGVPFLGVGLLYRQGYFSQTIDASGNQNVIYNTTNFDDLPITAALNSDGKEIIVDIELEDRSIYLKVWLAKAGLVTLYLLDCDIEQNNDQDRTITFQLYGGDLENRILQELVLGIGGVRALRALGLKPNIWHINEGHAAFQILERAREYINEQDMDFDSALELVACATVFTTHTPVSAGHDIFTEDLITKYLKSYILKLKLSSTEFMKIATSPNSPDGFNMTALALRGSRFHNGVSRIHGSVASRNEGYIWDQVPYKENPISYITNGVHAQTFLSREWTNLFDNRFRLWRNKLLDEDYWSCIDEIPDHRFWSLRNELKTQLLEYIYPLMLKQHKRNGSSDALLKKLTFYTSQPENDVLIIGFARRFATYKRATLIFSDIDRLKKLLNNPDRPMMLIFAGKAHPNDVPGQDLIRQIHEYALQPEFIGKIILLENYDLALARKLVRGSDVWLNTPVYPMEASGTSGEKAAINGVINLSMLDGWWGEGFTGNNGWGIAPHNEEFDENYRNQQEASDLLDILEYEVIPIFFDRGNHGYSHDWVEIAKNSMKTCIPRFNSQRMVKDYVFKFYCSAKKYYLSLVDGDQSQAKKLSLWKNKVRNHWQGVTIRCIDCSKKVLTQDEVLSVSVAVFLNSLSSDDVIVECLVGRLSSNNKFDTRSHYFLSHKDGEANDKNEDIFTLDLKPLIPGLNHYKIRVYPYHDLLSHPFEMGCLFWV
ncbi:MAG: alpha-glucan family phosphorylase [Thiohalomonadales bacterium]